MRRNSGIGKMVLIIVLGVIVVLAGIGIVLIKDKKHSGPVKLPEFEMALGDFVVNLADTNEVRYLKVNIVLVAEGSAPKVESSEGEGKGGGSPKVRDAIIAVLSSKHFSELATAAGKEELKIEIIEAINKKPAEESTGYKEAVKPKDAGSSDGLNEEGFKVVDVYFNEFAMQ